MVVEIKIKVLFRKYIAIETINDVRPFADSRQ